MVSRNFILALALIFLFVGASLAYLGYQRGTLAQHPGGVSQTQSSSACLSSSTGNQIMKSQLKSATFGAVTKFQLPSPGRAPNAITVAPDGSVWFGEQAIPGVGHLYPNGTLVEYRWSGNYNSSSDSGYSCSYQTDTWGIALW